MYLKMALGNIKRNALDYLVYFITLCIAVCLLYSFTASADYLTSLELTADQHAVYARSGDTLRAFSVLVVIVFACLIAYANRFITRRRKRELGTYALLGTSSTQTSGILAIETSIMCAVAFATGIACGIALSPAFSAVAAYAFGVAWRPSWTLSGDAVVWSAECFIALAAFSVFTAARSASRQTLAEQMNARQEYVSRKQMTPAKRTTCFLAAAALLAITWYACSTMPTMFVTLLLPMGLLALSGTFLLVKPGAPLLSNVFRYLDKRYLRGMRPLAVRLNELAISKAALPLSCACVMVAAATCMICAGLSFGVGMRADPANATAAIALAPIGYVGILYGATFIVASFAVAALHQVAFFVDTQEDLIASHLIGADPADLRRLVLVQAGGGFATIMAIAAIHDVFGLGLVRFLSDAIGSSGFASFVVLTAAATTIIGLAYYALTCGACLKLLRERIAA